MRVVDFVSSFRVSARSPGFWLVLVVGVLRLSYCFSVPLYSTDILRNLGYGIEFHYYGLRVYEMTPYDFSPEIYQYFWPNHHYTYPAVTLLFFAAVAKVWASIVFAKLLLTAVECLNGWLVYRVTQDRWCAWLYFCHPLSLWFVSHEGQFEPIVNLLTLLSLLLWQKNRLSAFLFLSLAVQTKLFPIFLFPLFLARMLRLSWRRTLQALGWGCIGLLPSGVAAWNSAYLAHLFLPGYVPKSNPITWALMDHGLQAFTPLWIVLSHWIAGIVFLGAILVFMRSEQRFLPFLAPLIFVAFVKANPVGQFWYMLLTPVFCLPVEHRNHRRILLALTLPFGLHSLWSIVAGPVGYCNPSPVMDILRRSMFGI